MKKAVPTDYPHREWNAWLTASLSWIGRSFAQTASDHFYHALRLCILGGACLRLFVVYKAEGPLLYKAEGSLFVGLAAQVGVLAVLLVYSVFMTGFSMLRPYSNQRLTWLKAQVIVDTAIISAIYVQSHTKESISFIFYVLPLMVAAENLKRKWTIGLIIYTSVLITAYILWWPPLYREALGDNIVLRHVLPRLSFLGLFAGVIIQRTTRLRAKEEELDAVISTFGSIAQNESMSLRLRAIMDASTDLLGAKGCIVYFIVHDLGVAKVVALKGIKSDVFKMGYEIPLDRGLIGEVYKEKATLIVNNYSKYPKRIPELSELFQAVIESPLLFNKEPIGFLAVLNDSGRSKFSYKDDVPLLERFAKYAAVALHDMQLLVERQTQAKEIERQARSLEALNLSLEALNTASGEMTRSLYLEDTLPAIARGVSNLAVLENPDPPRVFVGLVEEGGQRLAIRAAHPQSAFEAEGCPQKIELDEATGGIVGRVVRTRESQLISNVSADLDYVERFPDTVSELAVPIVSRNKADKTDKVIGVINIEHHKENAFSEALRKNVEILASQAVSAIENDFLFDEIERQRQVADSLRNAFVKMIIGNPTELSRGWSRGGTQGLAEVAKHILQGLRQAVYHNRATFQQINGDERKLLAKTGLKEQEIDPYLLRPVSQDSLVTEILETRDIKIIPSVNSDSCWETVAATGDVRSWVGMPLVYGESVIALITIDAIDENAFSESQRESLGVFSDLAASVFQNALLLQRLSEQVDELSQTKAKLELFLNDFEAFGNLAVIGLVYGESIHYAKDRLGLANTCAADISQGMYDHDLQALRRTAEQIGNYIDQYLDVLRQSQEAVLPSPEMIDVENLIEQVVESKNFSGSIESYYYFNTADPLVFAPKQQLRQILFVVVQNAIDAMRVTHGGKLIIKTESSSRNGNRYILISVSDTGCGIPDEKQADLFRLKKPTGKRGSGIGLAWAYQFVRAYGGDLTFSTKKGKGTSMEVLIPQDFRSPLITGNGR